jgi:hypothetical protein
MELHGVSDRTFFCGRIRQRAQVGNFALPEESGQIDRVPPRSWMPSFDGSSHRHLRHYRHDASDGNDAKSAKS